MNPTVAQIWRAAFCALAGELVAWKPTFERAMFCARAVLSVAAAVLLANQLHLSNTWWAAISAFVVAQTSWADSLRRAVQRMLGTVLGACLGALAGPWLGDRPWLFIPFMALIGGISVDRANRSTTAYAWLLGAITGLMVTFQAHLLVSLRATATFAVMRIAEVAVGTVACLAISGLFDLGLRWYGRSPGAPAVLCAVPGSASAQLRTTLGIQGALAIALLTALTYALRLQGLMQAMVTVVAVLVLPEAVLSAAGHRPVVEKMTQRLIGCLLAGALGLALLPLMNGHAHLCMALLSIGVWIGCHVQSGPQGASYVGRQFTIAFIMVFVQDHGWSANPGPALTRLSGILAGIVVLAAVMLATRRF